MTSYQEVFKDTFPAVVFSDEWNVVTSEDDPLLDRYGQATATRTNVTGATMTFRFFGNNIDIYGSRRPTHGEYHVTIDGVTYPTLDASSPTPLFNQTLFNATLANDKHHVVLTKLGDGTTLDIDYISMDAIVGTPTDVLDSDSFQDDDPSYHYTGHWYFPTNPGIYSATSAHITKDPHATLRHYFRVSTSVNVYGGVSPTGCAAYSVSLDGGPFEVFSARRKVTRTPQVLYFANNLGPGEHNILIQFNTTDPSTMGEFLVDFSNVYTLPSLGGSSFILESDLRKANKLASRELDSTLEHSDLGSAVFSASDFTLVFLFGLIGLVVFVLKQRRMSKI